MDSKKSKQVYEILLMPIEFNSEKYKDGNVYKDYKIEEQKIFKYGSVIKSTQSYYPKYGNVRYEFHPDPDMTDFACGFYEIIYDDILEGEKKIVDKDGNLSNRQFAGDTMNGFNYIANRIPQAGETTKKRTPQNKWPDYLQKYHIQYHCLANFWLLPMEIGRKNKKNLSKGYYYGAQDYMDKFLMQVKDVWSDYVQYRYFQKIKNFEKFAKINHLVGSYIYSDMSVFEYSEKTPEEIICFLQDRLRLRATAISKSEQYCDKLYEYFGNCGLIKKH